MLVEAIILLAALACSILSSTIGVGAVLLLPLFALQLGAKPAVAVLTIYLLAQNISKIAIFWRYIDFHSVKRILVYSIPGVIVGGYLLLLIPEDIFRKVVAACLMALLIFRITKKNKPTQTPSKWFVSSFSVFYGLVSGAIGLGNIVRGQLFISMGILKERFMGTAALVALAMNIVKLSIYSSGNVLDKQDLTFIAPLLIMPVIGTFIGKRLIVYISEKWFRIIIDIIFLALSILLFFK